MWPSLSPWLAQLFVIEEERRRVVPVVRALVKALRVPVIGANFVPLAEQAVKEREHRVRRVLEAMPAGAYLCDRHGLITYFNHHAERLWGRAPKINDPVDRYCGSLKLYSADGTPIKHSECWMALALRDEAAYDGKEIIIERPDGTRVTVLAHSNPIWDDEDELIRHGAPES